MKKLYLLLGIHDHQPVGNFDHVFREAMEKSYIPFLEEVSKYPKIRFSLHITGPIWEWAEKNYKYLFDIVKDLAKNNQIDFLGGGFYEPILSQIPREDIEKQINLMRTYLKENFNKDFRGIWLAERVWDESLPEILAPLNIEYTILDDTHFIYAGLKDKEIKNYFITEKRGHILKIFPIDKNLRYKIPFDEPKNVINYLKKRLQESSEDIALTYADDGEKFGIWPGTYELSYKDKWLERFFKSIYDNLDWIEIITFSEYLDIKNPDKKLFIPPASYDEMMEWSIINRNIEFLELKEKLQKEGLYERYKNFIRGGMWDNFLIKYHESNNMLKKAFLIHKRIKDNKLKIHKDIENTYLKGECNCSYWHGLFGGVYLNYIRDANYTNYINAIKDIEKLIYKDKEFSHIEKYDYDRDGKDEIIYDNKYLEVIIKPDEKASVMEIDFKPTSYNITNTLKRRREYYYSLVRKREKSPKKVETIHAGIYVDDISILKEVFEDRYPKYSFYEIFLDKEERPTDRIIPKVPPSGDISYKLENISTDEIKFSSKYLDKIYSFSKDYSTMEVKFIPKKKLDDYTLYTEMNLSFLTDSAEDRYIETEDGKRIKFSFKGEIKNSKELNLYDLWKKTTVKISISEKGSFYIYPVYTIALSEKGLYRVYQGSSFLLKLPPREFSIKFEIGKTK